ncbi:unnamed protein product [Phaedon cochleariae]|uniref:Uncharacterized protein n=1 Tax=Phaedon cochleariae TaxID=80249 RepID=A0A9N9SL37_PHACE|nr:unnamed protein product [Phaedon cochleariae]
MHKNKKSYTQVRIDEGGGTRRIPIDENSRCKAILQTAINSSSPNGQSTKGNIDSFDVQLLDYKSHKCESNLTVQEMYGITGLSTSRFYLATTYKVDLPTEENADHFITVPSTSSSASPTLESPVSPVPFQESPVSPVPFQESPLSPVPLPSREEPHLFNFNMFDANFAAISLPNENTDNDRKTTKLIVHRERETIKTASENFENVDREELLDIITIYDSKWVPAKNDIQQLVRDIAHKELVQKPAYVVKCFNLELKQKNI